MHGGGVDVGTGSRIRSWLLGVLIAFEAASLGFMAVWVVTYLSEFAHYVHGTADTRQGRLVSDLHELSRTAIYALSAPICVLCGLCWWRSASLTRRQRVVLIFATSAVFTTVWLPLHQVISSLSYR